MFWLLNIARAAEISTSIPGPYDVAATGPVGFIANFYYFALGFGGLLAFGAIVYAGIRWTTSQGNSGTISDAKDQIVQALWGLVLLGGAVVILNTINPELTVLQIPQLSQVSSTPAAGGGVGGQLCGSPDPTKPGACSLSGQTCAKKDCSTGIAGNSYHCCVASSALWVCNTPDTMDEFGNSIPGEVKYCTKPTSLGGGGDSACNTQCHVLVGSAVNCASEQDTGQCAGKIH